MFCGCCVLLIINDNFKILPMIARTAHAAQLTEHVRLYEIPPRLYKMPQSLRRFVANKLLLISCGSFQLILGFRNQVWNVFRTFVVCLTFQLSSLSCLFLQRLFTTNRLFLQECVLDNDLLFFNFCTYEMLKQFSIVLHFHSVIETRALEIFFYLKSTIKLLFHKYHMLNEL